MENIDIMADKNDLENVDVTSHRREATDLLKYMESSEKRNDISKHMNAEFQTNEKVRYLKGLLTEVAKVSITGENSMRDYSSMSSPMSIPGSISSSETIFQSIDIKSYLDLLASNIDQIYIGQVHFLQHLCSGLESCILELETNYSEEKYVQAIGLEAKVAISFSNLIADCWKQYNTQDIDVTDATITHLQAGVTSQVMVNVPKLIFQGKEYCARLLGSIIGEEEKERFVSTIEAISNIYISGETKIDGPRFM